MVHSAPCILHASGGVVTVELHPHRSLGTTGVSACVGSIGLVAFGATGIVAVTGAWPALIFAALVVVLAAACFWINHRERLDLQQLILDEESIHVRLCERGHVIQSTLPRYWTRAILHEARTASESCHLVLEHRGRTLEIGQFLTDESRRELAASLRTLIGPMAAAPPLPLSVVIAQGGTPP